eukprot:5758505-Alexandrium_andersonii.AAC.1
MMRGWPYGHSVAGLARWALRSALAVRRGPAVCPKAHGTVLTCGCMMGEAVRGWRYPIGAHY